MNSLSRLDNKTKTEVPILANPIIATLQSSTCIFTVRCEATGEWLSSRWKTAERSGEEKKKQMRETLKKVEGQFYKVEEYSDNVRVTFPTGFWLSDGRLVSPHYKEGERVKAYFGSKEEILSMGRKIEYRRDSSQSPHAF